MTATDTSAPHFDFGRVVSRTFSLVGRNFVPFAVLSAIFVGVPALIMMAIQPSLIAQAQADPTLFLLVTYLGGFVSYLVSLVLAAALTRASVDDLSGRPVAIGTALSTGFAVALPMLGLGIVIGVAIVFGLFLLIVPGIYLALRWAVSAQVLVVEGSGIFKSMERSASLTQNHRWAILGLIVLFFVALIVIQAIVLLAVPGSTLAMTGYSSEFPSIVALVVLVAVQVISSMVATVGAAAIYFELRQIKEGVGVHELAQVFA